MKKLKYIILLLVMVGVGTFVYMNYGSDFTDLLASAKNQTPQVPQQTRIKITAVGDCAYGWDHRFRPTGYMDDIFAKNNNDYKYFLKNVSSIFKADDLTIANLETALTTRTEKPFKYDGANNYWFKGDPKYANIFKVSSVEVAGLANNHTYDYKKEGYNDTKESLKKYGIGYYGYDDLYEKTVKGIKIGIAGFNQLGNVEQGTDINELKAEVKSKISLLRSRNDLVIVSFHWGKEYKHTITETQQILGHYAIDSGADLVIGHHPHVIQGTEQYKGKYIIYSLGNFSFGANKRPPEFDTYIYQQEFVFNADKKLTQAVKPNYIPCYISTNKYQNNFQPIPVKGSEAERILNVINEYSVTKTGGIPTEKVNLVELKSLIPNLIIEQRYASTNNITGEVVYKNVKAVLRKSTADKLKVASDILYKKGYKIKVWDAYRPAAMQQLLYDKAENKLYFADPKKGSNHTRGCAVDITLTDLNGNQIAMPTDFDDMTGRSQKPYKGATQKEIDNAKMLEAVMQRAGFKSIKTEWWHFDDSNYKQYAFIQE